MHVRYHFSTNPDSSGWSYILLLHSLTNVIVGWVETGQLAIVHYAHKGKGSM